MSWGEKLKERREELGYTLQTAEEKTKIRKTYLRALENEDFAVLPPRVYATGFVKNYARFLDMDEKQVTQQFIELAYNHEPINEEVYLQPSPPQSSLPSWVNGKNLAAAVVFLLLAIWAGNYLVSYFSNQHIVEEPTVKPPLVEPQEPSANTGEEPEQIDEGEPVTENVNLVILAHEDCWLEVTIDGVSDYFALIKAGEKKTFIGQEAVFIKAGNAGGIEINLNGENLGIFGDVGQVKRQDFTLDM